jgi:hypothetical protein
MSGKVYGTTSTGDPVDDDLLDQFADEAQRGYSAEELREKPRGRGRPPLGADAKTVESVRLSASMRAKVADRALADGVTVSDVIRDAIGAYIDAPSKTTTPHARKRG